MSNEDEQDLQATRTEGFTLGEKKTIAELNTLDADDESLAKWKASLLSSVGDSDPSLPIVELVALRLHSDTLSAPIMLDLSSGSIKDLAKKEKVIQIKEDSDFSVELEFKVNREVVSGLRYLQVVKRAGIKIDKLETMVGSYPPSAIGTTYKKRFPEETSPSGMLARSGTNSVRSRVTDDDGKIYGDWEWSFKITKDW